MDSTTWSRFRSPKNAGAPVHRGPRGAPACGTGCCGTARPHPPLADHRATVLPARAHDPALRVAPGLTRLPRSRMARTIESAARSCSAMDPAEWRNTTAYSRSRDIRPHCPTACPARPRRWGLGGRLFDDVAVRGPRGRRPSSTAVSTGRPRPQGAESHASPRSRRKRRARPGTTVPGKRAQYGPPKRSSASCATRRTITGPLAASCSNQTPSPAVPSIAIKARSASAPR